MKEVLFKILDKFSKGVDIYHNNGSIWLIFTNEKEWVIELTEDGTLWYNFYFFKDCFKYLSLNVVENQHYITEWVEDTLQNGVRNTCYGFWDNISTVEYTIQNGVRSASLKFFTSLPSVEDTIQNGVRHTLKRNRLPRLFVEDTLKNGIKETHEDVYHNKGRVDGVIRNGIKETKGVGPSEVTTKEIEKVIKETIELPDKSGELNGYGEYYARQKDRTYPHTDIVNDVITDGIKQTNWRKVDNHPTYLDHILIEK